MESILDAIWKLRVRLAHFKVLAERNEALLPSDIDVRRILNGLAEVLYLLGYQKHNTPHYVEEDGEVGRSIQGMIDALISSDLDEDGKSTVKEMRKRYLEGRKNWFKEDAK